VRVEEGWGVGIGDGEIPETCTCSGECQCASCERAFCCLQEELYGKVVCCWLST